MNRNYIDNQIKWLNKYIDAEIKAVRRAVDKVEGTNKLAVDKVEKTNEAKFESQNEFRGQLRDQAAGFVTRRELWGAVITAVTLILSGIALISKFS